MLRTESQGRSDAHGWEPRPARTEGGRAMRTLLAALALAGVLSLGSVTATDAAQNPSGTGQPAVECGDPGATVEPAGFASDGFAHAETVYAGSDGSASALH